MNTKCEEARCPHVAQVAISSSKVERTGDIVHKVSYDLEAAQKKASKVCRLHAIEIMCSLITTLTYEDERVKK